MSGTVDNCAVQIAVRERVVNSITSSVITYHSNEKILIVDDLPFTFDHILRPCVTQQQLFETLFRPLVNKVKQGFNCTALAYGQTGTGKTYTMGLNPNVMEDEDAGVIPRCLREFIVHNANEMLTVQRQLFVSFIEIYNEKVYDLLAENSSNPMAARVWKSSGGTRRAVADLDECNSILISGTKNRHFRPTKMNAQSSRSHAVFSIHVLSTELQTGRVTNACLNLVDLAGSEGVRRTEHKGVAKSEGVHINQGLLCIGKVLQAMALRKKMIPYRDSCLSHVLEESLSPNSYLTLLACVSPRRVDIFETKSTLRFAQSAKQVKHTPQVNLILAEFKNKSKTPCRRTPMQSRNGQLLADDGSISPLAASLVMKRTGAQLRNTFCTPSKLKCNKAAIKLNQTEMRPPVPTIQDIPQIEIMPFNLLRLNPPLLTKGRDAIRESLLSDATEMSLNLSSSTTLSAHVRSETSSFSPIIRNCMENFELIVDNKMQQMMESLRSEIQQLSASTAASTTMATLNPGKQCHVAAAADSTVVESSENNDMNSVNSMVKSKLFTTSSPIFKVPEVPATKSASFCNDDNELSLSCRTLFECGSSANSKWFTDSTNGQESVVNRSVRRSQRLSCLAPVSEHDAISLMASATIMNTTQTRRRSRRLSLIQEHTERRRSVRRAAHLDLPENKPNEVQGPQGTSRTTSRQRQPASQLDNSVIAGYLDGSVETTSSSATGSDASKKSKHRKAILNLLNQGSTKQLQVLPQIGQKTAYQLVSQRVINGKFKSLAHVAKLPIWRGKSWERFAKANILL